MKRKLLYILLGAELAALLALMLLTKGLPEVFSSVMAFPFEQIAMGLRWLSLTGTIGNGVALALWAVISALPLLPLLHHVNEKGRGAENASLCFFTALLLFSLYEMANPSSLAALFPATGGEIPQIAKAVLGTAVWSAAVLCVIFRLLRLFREGSTDRLLGYLRVMLYVLCTLFTGALALSCGSILTEIKGDMNGVMAILRFLVAALPYVLDIAVTLSALTLLDVLLSDEKSSAADCAHRLSSLCCVSLGATAASVVLLNVLQLALSKWLSDVAVSVNIPVMSIAFVLAALLFARLIAENRRLQNDNDLFI